jgi:uncharacterized heparinase superfamily protein
MIKMQRLPFFQNVMRLYHTLKYLKPIQIYGQIKFRLPKPKIKKISAPILRVPESLWVKPVAKHKVYTAPNQLTFLNQSKDISSTGIWSDPDSDKLWLYNLHYFDVLNSEADTRWQENLIKRWINENPIGKGNGWEPYTISLRIVNWIKWILNGNIADAEMLDSLATQINFLNQRLEIHILGNHLLANAKALLFAGCFFQGAQANRWLKKGFNYFRREIKNQILADGGHFELSPMYHAIILEDLLDVINISKTYHKTLPDNWFTNSGQMFQWLRVLSHPDDNIAFFNDTALGIAPTLSELEAYRQRLSLAVPLSSKTAVNHLTASGYVRAVKNNAVLIADTAPVGASYQPGHAHADTLSFEFSLGSQRLFVNSGTSTYANSAERKNQRATAAHNTLVMNDTNSSDVWKSFRVARRATVHDVNVFDHHGVITINASHDGYLHTHNATHIRQWELSENCLTIQDKIIGTQSHQIKLYFHLHPDVNVTSESETKIIFTDAGEKQLATMLLSHPVRILESTYHPGFNISQANKKLVIETVTALPAQFKTLITWN